MEKPVVRGKEILYAVTCALVGAALACSAELMLGSWPSPVIDYSLIIMGLGAALVTIRYGRLGPFQGEFGSPRLETDVRTEIGRETERAVRYGRCFTVVAVRQTAGPAVRWSSVVRRVDDVVTCRGNLRLLFLPETDPEGALDLLRRARELYSATLEAALVACPDDGRSGDDISLQLLALVREARRPNEVVVRQHGTIESVTLLA
jgi:hypothetical protein